MNYYLIKFDRFFSYVTSKLIEETVWVVLKTTIPWNDNNIEKWEEAAWNALWEQYPSWACPFNQSKPVKTKFDRLRHCWSSAFIREHIEITQEMFDNMKC
jgi:hypothetical protein